MFVGGAILHLINPSSGVKSILTLAGAAGMLARAKNAALHLEATVTHWDISRYSALVKDIWAHISHIRHLSIIETSLISYRELYFDDLKFGKLFHGITPILSFLELREINISWKSPFLTGLRYLKLYGLEIYEGPKLAEWLDALDNMPQLKQLVLHSASPTAPPFPFDIKRTVTLPFLTHLDISANVMDCALSLAHLVLPALTSLCLTADSDLINEGDVRDLRPYITKHAYGPQDTQPLQSVLFRSEGGCVDIAAWSMPGIYADRLPWSAMAKLTPRVALTISGEWSYTWVLDAAMEALPLDNLATLTAQRHAQLDEFIWLRYALRWPLLEHARLAPRAARGLSKMILEDSGGRESPLLPSLTKLDLIYKTALSARRTRRLCNALERRAEQRVPLKALDLGKCRGTISAVWRLGNIVIDIRSHEELSVWEEGCHYVVWDPETRGHFVRDEESEDEVDTIFRTGFEEEESEGVQLWMKGT
jgi:hypothetical protein